MNVARTAYLAVLLCHLFIPTFSGPFNFNKRLNSFASLLRNATAPLKADRFLRLAHSNSVVNRGTTVFPATTQNDQILSDNTVQSLDLQEQYHPTIQQALALAERYCSLHPLEFWEFLGHEQDIMVWKLKKIVCEGNKDDNAWPCIRSVTTIDLPVEQLADIIMDSSKVKLYNKYSDGRTDIVNMGPNSKIVWSRTKIPLAMKSYDFSTLMHRETSKVDPQTTLIVSKAVKCSEVPEHRGFSRSEIIFGLNILTPSKGNRLKTELTSISHVRYAGTPSFVAARTALQGALTYFKSLKEAIAELHPVNSTTL